MKKIYFSGSNKDKFFIVDDCDFDELSKYKWYLNSGYALRRTWDGKKAPSIFAHRQIMNPPKNKIIDHINRNKLDNRKSNLRVCTSSENRRNSIGWPISLSKYKGVTRGFFRKKDQRQTWRAQIELRGKCITLGYYITQEEAAGAYNHAALKHYGQFAKINEFSLSD